MCIIIFFVNFRHLLNAFNEIFRRDFIFNIFDNSGLHSVYYIIHFSSNVKPLHKFVSNLWNKQILKYIKTKTTPCVSSKQ